MDDGGQTRILLVADPDPGEVRLATELRARGFEVLVRDSAAAGLEALGDEGADVALLALPLAGSDPVALCAAVKESPWAPVLILVDATGQAEGVAASLPEALGPDAVLGRPVDAGKVAIEVHEQMSALDFTDGEPVALGVSLPELLLELRRREASEVLEVRADQVCTSIHLREGRAVFAEGGSLQDTLGRLLVRKGHLDQEQYARVVQRMTEGIIRHESLRMGEVLVELGMMTNAEVYDALSLQVREKIVACFQWDAFAYELREPVETDEDLGIFQCPPIEALILAGVRAHYGPPRLAPLLGPLADGRLVLRRPAAELVPAFQLSAPERKFLQNVEGPRGLAALRSDGGLDPIHADQLLAALSLCGELDVRTEAVAGRDDDAPAPRSRPAVADAPPSEPTPKGIAFASITPTKRPRPGSPLDSLTQLRRQMGAKSGRPGGDDRKSRLEAEHAFNQGLRLLHESLLPGALKEFRRAAKLKPDEAEYRMLEAWLEYRLARGAKERAPAVARVREAVKLMLQTSRSSARAHSILGQLAHADGDTETAANHFKLAVRYDPDDAEANRFLRLINLRSAAKK